MSSRLALRWAAMEALRPAATVAGGPYPTLAGALVYDSRIDIVEGDQQLPAELENKPLIIVYTEDDDADTIDDQVKYPADVPICHLSIEMMIATSGVLEVTQEDGSVQTFGTVTAPVTDPSQEATLDLLESQVRRLLGERAYEDRPASSKLFNKIAMEVRQIRAQPKRSADGATRLAARTCVFKIKTLSEQWPLDLGQAQTAPTGFDLLPEPLRTVAKALPTNSYAYPIAQNLVGLVHVPVERQPLLEIHGFIGLDGRTPTQTDGSDSDVQVDITLNGD